MMNWTFPLFRIFGIPVRMHLLMAIYIAAQLVTGFAAHRLFGLGWVAVTMAILIVTILFHELAHCWMAIRLGAGAEQILLWPLGGLAYVGHTGSARDEIKISAVGPLSNFVLGGALIGVAFAVGIPMEWMYFDPLHDWWFFELSLARNFLLHAIRINFILGLFNLLVPAYPLDGGRILFSLLTIQHGRRRAAEVTSAIAIIVGIALAVWAIAGKTFELALIALWVLVEAFRLRHLAAMGELDSHPAFASAPEYEYMPERPRRKGWFGRWRERRAQGKARRELERERTLRDRVDSVLEKVSREGIGSLSPGEKDILDRASRRNRGD